MKIGDPHWIIDKMLLPASSGILFLVSILMKGETSDKELTIFALLGFGVLFFVLGGKEGVCVKMEYLSEKNGSYLNIIGLTLFLILVVYLIIDREEVNRKYIYINRSIVYLQGGGTIMKPKQIWEERCPLCH